MRAEMRLATLREGGRDGTLVIADRGLTRYEPAPFATLQDALDEWAVAEPRLAAASRAFERSGGEPIDLADLAAPLPRAYQWAEASTYTVHLERLRKGRDLELPPDHGETPAAYNSGSDAFLGGGDPVPLRDASWGLDLEATIAVITDDVPMGVSVAEAGRHIKLVVLVNDLTLRHILSAESARGIGFFQAKPNRSMAPFAVSPASLGSSWDDGLLRATVRCDVNGERLGSLDSGEDAAFTFPEVISHLARTRPLGAGSVIGTGTVANRKAGRGFGAIAERRAIEEAMTGQPQTSLLRAGDRIRIEALGADGHSLFGPIDQLVVVVA
jgi:fumarylacetoacetate (FAA) hydrolase